MRRVAILGIVIVVGLAAWWGLNVLPQAQHSMSEASIVSTSTSTTSQWQWEFDSAGEDPQTGVPKTNVTLRNGGTSYSIGATEGTCFDVAQSDWKLLTEEGELAGAICWWAGGGKEIGVFSEEGKAVIKIGDVDEAVPAGRQGTAESPGTRGNFKTLFAIDFGFIRGLDAAKRTISFDRALWLSGKAGEDAAIAAGLCAEATRAECLPNDYFIYNEVETSASISLASNASVYMVTWNAGEQGIKRQFIKLDEFASLINDATQHWNKLPYNLTVKNGEVIMIEEVYIP